MSRFGVFCLLKLRRGNVSPGKRIAFPNLQDCSWRRTHSEMRFNRCYLSRLRDSYSAAATSEDPLALTSTHAGHLKWHQSALLHYKHGSCYSLESHLDTFRQVRAVFNKSPTVANPLRGFSFLLLLSNGDLSRPQQLPVSDRSRRTRFLGE